MFDTEIFKSLIEQSGLTQKQVAKTIDIPYSSLISYLRGASQPSLENLFKIADFFAVPIDLLMGRYSKEECDKILENYSKYYKELRVASFEQYLIGGRPLIFEDRYEPPYPYNLLEAIKGISISWIYKKENMEGLEWALSHLSEREKECIDLYYKQEQTFDEISQKFNVTRERVRQIILRALRRLRSPAMSNAIFQGFHSINEVDAYAKNKLRELEKKENILKNKEIVINSREAKFDIEMKKLKDEGFSQTANKIMSESLDNTFILSLLDNTTIDKLDLSIRAYHILIHANIETVNDIVSLFLNNAEKILKFRGMGRKSYNELLVKLDDYFCSGDKFQKTYAFDKMWHSITN